MQKGIALLQVLLITAVLSLLALFITKTARQQVAIASAFDDRALALVKSYDAEASVLFALLTEFKLPTTSITEASSDLVSNWNFYGKPISLSEDTQITLQDLRGLLNLKYPNETLWHDVLTRQGLSDYDSRLLLSQLQDWQDTDHISRHSMTEPEYKNGVIQVWSELEHLNLDEPIRRFIEMNSTMFRLSIFNPMTSPDTLIRAMYEPSIAEEIIRMRDTNTLTPKLFSAYTGVKESTSLFLFPSNNFKMTLETQVGEARIHRTLHYLLKPRNSQPVNLVASEG
ncbi:hypothetical protein ACSLBF_15150 [Pseudoalteromonas sp. T1lg65]|uniref:hypothetical protein n=1 Tax=Pseudoalteromonas sp. T1lg65 TaxID=2077101 RepID=UPI003F7AE846